LLNLDNLYTCIAHKEIRVPGSIRELRVNNPSSDKDKGVILSDLVCKNMLPKKSREAITIFCSHQNCGGYSESGEDELHCQCCDEGNAQAYLRDKLSDTQIFTVLFGVSGKIKNKIFDRTSPLIGVEPLFLS
jgi:hypothetical protein